MLQVFQNTLRRAEKEKVSNEEAYVVYRYRRWFSSSLSEDLRPVTATGTLPFVHLDEISPLDREEHGHHVPGTSTWDAEVVGLLWIPLTTSLTTGE